MALAGAEPILRFCTDERSALAIASLSSSIMAIIGGTEVSHVQRKRPIASMYGFTLNCGMSTMLACPASTRCDSASAFMW
ncbi:Uncharacterised protein [Mycobacterium tuberculosis]|nr:Uncharacterised protein [Mycobacterium tuberculosis]